MLGILPPLSGSCSYGDIPTCEIINSLLFSIVRYFPQHPEIFDDDLLYNVTIGKSKVSQDAFLTHRNKYMQDLSKFAEKNQLENATVDTLVKVLGIEEYKRKDQILRQALSAPTVCELLAGYLTNYNYYIDEKYDKIISALEIEHLCGRNFGPHGSHISGGEKSKIALARFLLTEDAAFFILDEPLTNIDILALKSCISAFDKFRPGKAGLVVSHNMQVINTLCENILVFQEEQPPCFGTQAELIENNDFYRRLVSEYQNFNSV